MSTDGEDVGRHAAPGTGGGDVVAALRSVSKALVSAVGAGLGAAGVALIDDQITRAEWVGVAIAAVGTLSAVWGTPTTVTGMTPDRAVAARVNASGDVVAGAATPIPDGTPVDLTASTR